MNTPNLLTRLWLPLFALAGLVVFPWVAPLLDLQFYVSFVQRVMIFALLAASLNFILGYGGMVALGHAAFFGAGAYTVAILAHHGVTAAIISWPLAVVIPAALALVIGAISLRTQGVYFIMITLAFAQMIYYVGISLRAYGGEDGLNIMSRSVLPGIDPFNDLAFYYVVLVTVVLCLLLLFKLKDSHFGHALMGIRENEARMESLGFPVYRIKLTAFVIAAAIAGLAGALLANNNLYVSPSIMHWKESAHLIIMILIGGIGLRYGGVAGAVILLCLEEFLRMRTDYWHFWLGLILLSMVFFAPRGMAELLSRLQPKRANESAS